MDIGSGSGLFSLAALNLGVKQVEAFDFDSSSVKSTNQVIQDWAKKEDVGKARVYQGDVLSLSVNLSISEADLIYSWGVLHHTGNMEIASKKILTHMKKDSLFVLALYNDEGKPSIIWRKLKKIYVYFYPLRPILLAWSWFRFWGSWQIPQWLKGQSPWHYWSDYAENSRAMSAWHDLKDWAGGYPFEVASPEEVHRWITECECELVDEWLVTGIANNEFLIRKR